MGEIQPESVEHPNREEFLANLVHFLIEAGENGWAADAPKVEIPERPGFKEFFYQTGDWQYRDSYAGYFMAPGSSVVYLKNRPVWYMTYGGEGLVEAEFSRAKEIYAFLRRALMQPDKKLPIRGPRIYQEDDLPLGYSFSYDGSLASARWEEQIVNAGGEIFSQRGDIGIIVDKSGSRQPIYPWS